MHEDAAHSRVGPVGFEKEALAWVDSSQFQRVKERCFGFVEGGGEVGVSIPESGRNWFVLVLVADAAED